jgi:hypothetical protein
LNSGVCPNLLRGTRREDSACIEDGDSVAYFQYKIQDMFDQDDSDSEVAIDPENEVSNRVDSVQAEPCCRLIKEQETRPSCQSTRDLD